MLTDATIPPPVNILFASETEKAEFWLPLLEKALPRDRFTSDVEGPIDIALIASPAPGILEKLQHAKLIQSLWMGVERLLADPAYPRGVPLARLIDPGMVAAMSEMVIAPARLAPPPLLLPQPAGRAALEARAAVPRLRPHRGNPRNGRVGRRRREKAAGPWVQCVGLDTATQGF